MTRKHIQTAKGAIAHVSRPLWFAATEKLHEADGAITQMRNAHDRINYEAGWMQFVDSLEEFWARFFDEGKTAFTSFQPWAGAIDAQRKADELLNYLYQARHQSQHGRIAMLWEEPKLLIAPNFNGHIRGFKLFPDGTYEIDATPLQPTLPDATITHDPGNAILPIIKNKKHRQTFNPPIHFKGQPLQELTPISVAQLGLDFYRDIIFQGMQKFAPAPELSEEPGA
jgi:hypothetical protein